MFTEFTKVTEHGIKQKLIVQTASIQSITESTRTDTGVLWWMSYTDSERVRNVLVETDTLDIKLGETK